MGCRKMIAERLLACLIASGAGVVASRRFL